MVQIGTSSLELLVRRAEMLANHLDFLDLAGCGNSGMEQRIESIRLQGLLTGFTFIVQNIQFLIGEADHDLTIPRTM